MCIKAWESVVFFVDDIETADLLWTILIWVVVLLDFKFWKLLWTISTRTIWCNWYWHEQCMVFSVFRVGPRGIKMLPNPIWKLLQNSDDFVKMLQTLSVWFNEVAAKLHVFCHTLDISCEIFMANKKCQWS